MDYTILGKCRKYENLGIWMISIISIVIPLINEFFSNNTSISLIVEFFDFILIVAYYILNTVTEVFLYPATARKRRKGFIDNSLGSKYLEKEVEGYYSNDGINKGPFKIIVNCGENCYFTYNIAKTMLYSYNKSKQFFCELEQIVPCEEKTKNMLNSIKF